MIIDEATNLGFSLWQILHQGISIPSLPSPAASSYQLQSTDNIYKHVGRRRGTQWGEIMLEFVILLQALLHFRCFLRL